MKRQQTATRLKCSYDTTGFSDHLRIDAEGRLFNEKQENEYLLFKKKNQNSLCCERVGGEGGLYTLYSFTFKKEKTSVHLSF